MLRTLQCDVGNSAVKWRVLDNGRPVARGRLLLSDSASHGALRASLAGVEAVWVASVAGDTRDRELAGLLRDWCGVTVRFAVTAASTAGLVNSYREPHRMGVDRWLAMLGARTRCGAGPVCVVDAGSAITIDFVAADGHHEGGFILPGLRMMEQSLLCDTGRVRFSQRGAPGLRPGRDTATAVVNGTALAACGAVRLALAGAGTPAPRLVFSGGDGELLQALLQLEGDVCEDLVLDGLTVYAAAQQEPRTSPPR